jgi:hypothetical protein
MATKVSAGLDTRSAERLAEFERAGREIYWLPDEERARWVQAVQPVIADWAAEMEAHWLPGRAVVEAAHALVKEYKD